MAYPVFCFVPDTLQQEYINQGRRHLTNAGQKRVTSVLNWTTVTKLHNSLISRCMASLRCMHRTGPLKKKYRPKTAALEGAPQKRGVILKVMIKKPKKPNSANRKCVRVRLSNGNEVNAYVPGEGHNLQEHNIVLLRGGRLRDVPGVRLKCVRGKYDLSHVKKKTT